MPIPLYEKGHAVDCDVAPSLATLKNKSVVITGGLSSSIWTYTWLLWLTMRLKGANGLGEGYVRAFAGAGWAGILAAQMLVSGIWLTQICIRAFVTFGDINEQRGKEIERELSP
jgi:hypothetical protein